MKRRGLASRGRDAKTVIVLGCAALAAAAIPLQAGAATAQREAGVRSLVDGARARAGMGALRADHRLDVLAAQQSLRMAESGKLFHNPNLEDQADAAGVAWITIAENVGSGENVANVHRGFMASAHHRRNVLDPRVDTLGVGVAVASDGVVYVTQVFAHVGLPPAPSRANRPAPTVALRPAGATAGSDVQQPPGLCPASGFRVAKDFTLIANAKSCGL